MKLLYRSLARLVRANKNQVPKQREFSNRLQNSEIKYDIA